MRDRVTRLATALLLISFALAVRVCAADRQPAGTLEEVVRATLASEESLRVVEAEARKAGQRTKRYYSYLTPDVRLQGSYGWSDEEDTDADDNSAAQDRYGWGLVVTQPLYTGGRATAAYRGQQHLEASVRLQVELTGRALTVAAAQAYYRILGAAATVEIGETAIGLARRQLERATRRVELGEAVLNDQLRAEVTLRGLEAELAGARSTLAQAREEVRRLSGLELVASPAVPPPLPQIAGSDEALVAEALAARREPEQARLAVSAAEEEVREKKGRYLPSLALNAAYGEAGGELSDRPWSWSAGVVLEMPIYQGGATKYEVRESRLGLEQQRLRAAGASRDIEREVRNLLREIEAARSTVRSLDLGVAAAAENLRLAERRYEVGLADSIEVADGQRADVAARVGLVVARYRLEELTLQLLNALGRDLALGPRPATQP